MFDHEFLDKYPLSTTYIHEVFKKRINETFDKMGSISPDIREELLKASMNNQRLIEVLEDNPSILFEIFDEKSVYFYVYPYLEDNKVYFLSANINDKVLGTATVGYKTRREAEQHAIREAFDMLEYVLLSKIKVRDGKVVPDI